MNFDQFAQSYDDEHRNSIAFSGCEPDYFARYKAEIAARCFRNLGAEEGTLLDFGCGTGSSIPHFRAELPRASILAADVSSGSLDAAEARYGDAARYLPIGGTTLDIKSDQIDMAFAACVFHHIPPAEHGAWLSELRRVVKPGGGLLVFEHNPLNPLTRHAVASCAFDRDAVLLQAGTLAARLADSGWQVKRIRYHVFFPQVLAGLRRFEAALGLIPLGGQYSVLSIKA